MTNLELEQIGKVIRKNRFSFRSQGVHALADFFQEIMPGFNRALWYSQIEGRPYQPKTGQPCNCKKGQERDNCPTCEGTGMQVDFRAIRERSLSEKGQP